MRNFIRPVRLLLLGLIPVVLTRWRRGFGWIGATVACLIWTARPAVAAENTCVEVCKAEFTSCAATYAPSCGLAGGATERLAGQALGSVPGGALLAKAAGGSAKALCEQKLAPCVEAQTRCLSSCGEGGEPGDRAPPLVAQTPSPVVVFGAAPGAAIFVDGKRAGTMPLDPEQSYTSPPLSPGGHAFRVVNKAGAFAEATIQVRSGEVNSLEFDSLRTREGWELLLAVNLLVGNTVGAEERLTALAAQSRDPEVKAEASLILDGLRRRSALDAARAQTAALEAEQAARDEAASAAALAWVRLQEERVLPEQLRQADVYVKTWPQGADRAAVEALARQVRAERDRLMGPLLREVKAVEADSPGRQHTERTRLAPQIESYWPGISPPQYEVFLDDALVAANLWVPAPERGTVDDLWRAERAARGGGGRGALLTGHALTGAALAFTWLDPETHAPWVILDLGHAAFGAGALAQTMSHDRRLRQAYGSRYPAAGRPTHTGLPFYLTGSLELATFALYKSLLRDRVGRWAENYEELEAYEPHAEFVAEESVRASNINQLAIAGSVNLGFGAAASILRHTNALHGAHRRGITLSAGGLNGRF